MSAVLELRGVGLTLQGRTILDNVDLSLGRGESIALLGPSGSGKTSLLRIAVGLLAPTRGEIWIAGRRASAPGRIVVPPEERRLAMVFQDLALWPHMTAGQNLAFVLPRAADREHRVRAALDQVGLGAHADRHPGELSGGERQRVAIARALVADPTVVLLDEPLGNLDVALKSDLLSLFRTVLAAPVSAIHVTHDPREAAHLCSRLALLEAGRLTQVASPGELRRAPATPFARAVADALPAV